MHGLVTLMFILSFAADAELVSCVTTFEYDGCYAEGVEDPFSSKIGSTNMTPDVSSCLPLPPRDKQGYLSTKEWGGGLR